MSVPNLPDVPPTTPDTTLPTVPVGLATQTGLGAALLAAVLAAIQAVAGGVIDGDTKFLIASAVVSLVATVVSRGYQAAKLYAAHYGVTLPDRPLR
jgi:hypothetical protein